MKLWETGTLFWELPLLRTVLKSCLNTPRNPVCKKLPFASLPPKVGSIFLKPIKTMRSVMSIAMSTAGVESSKNQV